MTFVLIIFPLVMSGLAFLLPNNHSRPWLLPVNGCVHLAVTITLLINPSWIIQNEWLVLDPVSSVILLSVSVLYIFCSFYAVGYIQYRKERSNRIFTACLLAVPGLLSVMFCTHHLGLMWVAMEGTTLATAPLIYFNKTKRSIEATWKYLLVGSVGIALALLGTFFLAYSAVQGGFDATLDFDELLKHAPSLSKTWLRSAFILCLIGYGTKMGLAPMHTWKPDAYGETPAVSGAVLAGGVTSGAFLALLRMYQIYNAAGEGVFISSLLIPIGLFSMAVAGIFMVGQRDFKRMLAYSSIEHMGILTVGLGLGGSALFGVLLHVIANGVTKGVLFLSAGNIQRSYSSKNTDLVQGALQRIPMSAVLFFAGFVSIIGSPPFAPFVSEFTILKGAFAGGHFVSGFFFLFFLLVVFIGMGITVLRVVNGAVPENTHDSGYHDSFITIAPIIALMIISLTVGLFLPSPLRLLINEAVLFLENAL